MKFVTLIALGLASAMAAATVAPASADAQQRVVTKRVVTKRVITRNRSYRQGPGYRQTRRVCTVRYRGGNRIRTCRIVRR